MARKIDLPGLKRRSISTIASLLKRVEEQPQAGQGYFLARWICRMSAVELHGIWERYAENRLVASLNHDAIHFIGEQDIKGVTNVSVGLAFYIVRGGNRYFDFRSMADLISKADHITGSKANPFRAISVYDRRYLDALAAIRNCVVHGSDRAIAGYKATLGKVYGIKYAPGPDEFLNAVDNRAVSPARYQRRLVGLATIVRKSIEIA
jgi:hypothetical protein